MPSTIDQQHYFPHSIFNYMLICNQFLLCLFLIFIETQLLLIKNEWMGHIG